MQMMPSISIPLLATLSYCNGFSLSSLLENNSVFVMLYNNLDNYDDAIGADVIALQVQIFERL